PGVPPPFISVSLTATLRLPQLRHACHCLLFAPLHVTSEVLNSITQGAKTYGIAKSFHALQEERRERAERSVLISCSPKVSEKKLLKFLSQHGNVSNCFFYQSYGVYAVVEFASKNSIVGLHESTSLPSMHHEVSVPFKSRLLTLKTNGSADQSGGSNSVEFHPQVAMPINELLQQLSAEESVDQQLSRLTSALQLTEENVSLRFLVCSLVKDVAAAFFPKCTVHPFGSSVNGFGKLGCDLDMFLDLDAASGNPKRKPSGFYLEYQMKREASERAVTQSVLSVVAESVEQFSPGCVGIQKILNARCPLVRFSHQPSGFQCDLTANNRVAMKSSELLYVFSSVDERVRGLVLAVRYWARVHGVTSSVAGAWISNFSLTALILFFLQTRGPPILPTVDQLRDLADQSDQCCVEGNDCTIVSDLSRIRLQTNTESLERLLQEFFEFYAAFPFNHMSINLRKGKEQNKPESTPLHIQNPFEATLNVSKNVNAAQLDRFVALCRESAWFLQQEAGSKPATVPTGGSAQAWGLAALFLPSLAQAAGVKGRRKKKREPASERVKSLLQSISTSHSSQ
uniref:Mitochondrial poly(A) polymerase n=1 Tax=Denticeps clupeoides TaxID=299321 RepID=A0AAY3ZYT4_9TELE